MGYYWFLGKIQKWRSVCVGKSGGRTDMDFESSRILGCIGALLIFFGTGFTFMGSMDFGLIRTTGIIFVLFLAELWHYSVIFSPTS